MFKSRPQIEYSWKYVLKILKKLCIALEIRIFEDRRHAWFKHLILDFFQSVLFRIPMFICLGFQGHRRYAKKSLQTISSVSCLCCGWQVRSTHAPPTEPLNHHLHNHPTTHPAAIKLQWLRFWSRICICKCIWLWVWIWIWGPSLGPGSITRQRVVIAKKHKAHTHTQK